MKKFICAILTLSLATAAFARDFQFTYKGQTLTYTVTDESNQLCATKAGNWGVTGNLVSGKLEIPAIVSDGIQEYTVSAISDQTFYQCDNLTSVTLPNTVTEIGNSAFSGCKVLKDIDIPGPVTTIGNNAFYQCEKLMNIKLPDTVKYIGSYCFQECYSLAAIDIPPTMTTISANMFCACSKLTVVHLPNTITKIEANAFQGCWWLPNILIPNSVKSIGPAAFKDCRLLEEIVIPNSITEIAPSTFEDCKELYMVRIGHGLKKIGRNAFNNTSSGSLYITAQEPPVVEENALPKNIIYLYVQGKKAKELYSNAAGWKGYAPIGGLYPSRSINIKTDDEVSLHAGDQFRLWGSFSNAVVLTTLFWSSSDPAKAYVDPNGIVTILDDITESDEVYISAESLYAGAKIGKFMLKHQPVQSIADELTVEEDALMNVYNMQQSLVLSNATMEQVNRLPADIYIIRQGSKTFKKVIQ